MLNDRRVGAGVCDSTRILWSEGIAIMRVSKSPERKRKGEDEAGRMRPRAICIAVEIDSIHTPPLTRKGGHFLDIKLS